MRVAGTQQQEACSFVSTSARACSLAPALSVLGPGGGRGEGVAPPEALGGCGGRPRCGAAAVLRQQGWSEGCLPCPSRSAGRAPSGVRHSPSRSPRRPEEAEEEEEEEEGAAVGLSARAPRPSGAGGRSRLDAAWPSLAWRRSGVRAPSRRGPSRSRVEPRAKDTGLGTN
ncbi:unnamed protein product [Prorocentrum cordatum]|uniref:Uncharacterized protein n=1 Tax=Prorocentrum cordatum TaxID=2364126 RepID=A0ABN9R0U6_9DINO|nr:unnamed protein product [Polarella glacialis]